MHVLKVPILIVTNRLWFHRSQSSDDSDYEDDGLTEEKFKETEGYKLTMKCLDAMLGRPLP